MIAPRPAAPPRAGHPDEVLGNAAPVPVFGGELRPSAYLDNAASTPALRAVVAAVTAFLPWYGSVHRGAGRQSEVSTAEYEAARDTVRAFVNAGDRQTVTFIKSTTEGLNRLARLHAPRGTVVVTSIMEHHANLLPWRLLGLPIRYVQADALGVVDEDDLHLQLHLAPVGPRLVALSGAYNVSGYAPDIHHLARLAHEHEAEICIDGAQLVPHRQVDLRGADPAEAIDYLVFSAHKLYAPFGSGALIAPAAALAAAQPALLGGGAVDLVSLDEVVWSRLPERDEAGSPNVVGAVALAAAMQRLSAIGLERLEAEEADLTALAVRRLLKVPGLVLLGPPAGAGRVGVLSFVLTGWPHGLVAAALAHEHGIAVRSGCFCAHPGVLHLLGLPAAEQEAARARMRAHRHDGLPGAVRASLGLQNTAAEIERLAGALGDLVERGPRAVYREERPSGVYQPVGDAASRAASSGSVPRSGRPPNPTGAAGPAPRP